MGKHTSVTTSLVAGSAAGIAADLALYPIDTIKTRVQSSEGFLKAGGFQGVYRGLASAALGSAPAGASFFFAYEYTKNFLHPHISSDVTCHLIAGCCGETFSSFIRIPFEIVKQKAQVLSHATSQSALNLVLKTQGIRGLYRGYFSMLFREVPFTLTQMPLWEFFKSQVSNRNNGYVSAFQSGICGSVSGSIAAAVTTPLDVAKTRIILAQNNDSKLSTNPFRVMFRIGTKEGVSGLFAGIVPRVTYISVGGFVFLGAYDKTKLLLEGLEDV